MTDSEKLLSAFNPDVMERAMHPRISNIRLPAGLQRTLDNAVNELMHWSAANLAGLPQPPELTVVGYRLQANTVLLTLQRKHPEAP